MKTIRIACLITILVLFTNKSIGQTATCFKGLANSGTEYIGCFAPVGIAKGDLNGDGFIDLATANNNAGSSNVTVMINNGNGTYATMVGYPIDAYPTSIAIGDLNGDGFPDIAYTNNIGSGIVSLMFNSGTGTFSPFVSYNVGLGSNSVAIGDLNADGSADLAIANYSANTVSVLINTGIGTFAPKVDYVVGTQPTTVVIGDLNMDGKPDIGVANYGTGFNKISVLTNSGVGTFSTAVHYPAGTRPRALAIGDLNADGQPDVAVVNGGSNNFSVLMNNGIGAFLAPVNYATESLPNAIAIGDLDGDNDIDVGVSNSTSSSISVFKNIGTGIFFNAVHYSLGVSTTPSSLIIGDLNNNGKNDFAVSNNTDNNVRVLQNDGLGTFTAATLYLSDTGSPYSVAMGDLNGDGFTDLAVANYSSGTISVMLNTGVGTFAKSVNYAVGINATGVAIGDLNGDGMADIAVSNAGTPTSGNVLLNIGNGIYAPAISYLSGGTYSVSMGDLNMDGYPDLVFANYSGNGFSTILNNGDGTFGATVYRATGNYPQGATLGDVNNDSFLDVIMANTGSNHISVSLGNGTGTFGLPVNYPTTDPPTSVAVGDFNSDGFIDIAVAILHLTLSNVTVYTNTGIGTFVLTGNYPVGVYPFIVTTGDVNGDGKSDIATANYSNGTSASSTFSLLVNNGAGSFVAAENYLVGIQPRSIAIGDLNNDGKSDVAVTNSYSNTVSVLMNYTANITSTCQGNSYILHATEGGGSYLWSPGGSTADSLIATTSGAYSVIMSSPGASCTSSASVVIDVDSCNLVWPGDANNDFIVDNTDLLPIGLFYSSTGFPRASTSNLWQGYASSFWGTTQPSGADIKHVDCNGDGIIDSNDTLAINTNFSLSHTFTSNINEERLTTSDLYFITSASTYNSGDIVNVEVWLGNSTTPVNNLYGIAFNINYDASLVQPSSESITFPASWFGTPSIDAISIGKINPVGNTVYAGESRTDHMDVSGFGKIAEFKFQLKSSIPSNTIFGFSIPNYSANDANGVAVLFNTIVDSVMINPISTGMSESSDFKINVFPNPFFSQTNLVLNKEIKNGVIRILDVVGREVRTINFSGTQLIIEKDELGKGIYFIQISSENGMLANEKIVIQ